MGGGENGDGRPGVCARWTAGVREQLFRVLLQLVCVRLDVCSQKVLVAVPHCFTYWTVLGEEEGGGLFYFIVDREIRFRPFLTTQRSSSDYE